MEKKYSLVLKVSACVLLAICLFLILSKSSDENSANQTTNETTPQSQVLTTTGLTTDNISEEHVPDDSTTQITEAPTAAETEGTDWVPIDIKLPEPVFLGTPQHTWIPRLEIPTGIPRPPFLAPKGVTNVSLGKPVSSSDKEPIIGELKYITDADKEASEGSYVELGPFLQNVTIDLQGMYEIYAIAMWHYHIQPHVYFDVIVQVADDADFITNVRTLFNNDIDNTAGFGIGKDMCYTETSEGKLINARGVKARYVRLYSNGNAINDLNQYTEVEVYGRPVK